MTTRKGPPPLNLKSMAFSASQRLRKSHQVYSKPSSTCTLTPDSSTLSTQKYQAVQDISCPAAASTHSGKSRPTNGLKTAQEIPSSSQLTIIPTVHLLSGMPSI